MPIPGSPASRNRRPWPAKASSRPPTSSASSRSRPTNAPRWASTAGSAPPAPRRRQVQCRVLREYRPLELAEPLARLDAQLLDQRPARVLVGLQRVRLAVASGRGPASAAPAGAPGRDARRSAPPAGRRPRRGAPSASFASISCSSAATRRSSSRAISALREGLVGKLRQRRAAPQRQRPLERRNGAPRVAAGQLAPPLGHEPLEAVRVEALGIEPQLVAALARHDHAGRAVAGLTRQRLAQAGDLHLHRLGGVGGWTLAPQLVDQPVRA